MLLNLGGITQVSTSDWEGHSSMVIFFRGCPLRCLNCHNKELQTGENYVELDFIKKQIKDNFLISAVIFSGGEPLMQPEAVKELADYAHGLGLKVGIETSGYEEFGGFELFKHGSAFDKVFLDLKTYPFDIDEYWNITGAIDANVRAREILERCLWARVPIELRTTVFKDYPCEDNLDKIESWAKKLGVPWKKQAGRRV